MRQPIGNIKGFVRGLFSFRPAYNSEATGTRACGQERLIQATELYAVQIRGNMGYYKSKILIFLEIV